MWMDAPSSEDLRILIRGFLKDFKGSMAENKYEVKGNHKKNLDTLIQLGITTIQRDDVIRQLKVEDYCSGPFEDEYKPKDSLWVFGKTIDEHEIYIKLKIDLNRNQAICLSFHISEYPMRYPFKRN